MSAFTKLIGSETVAGEKRWTYALFITFNNQKLTRVTITDHVWKKKGRAMITKQLILNLLQAELNNKRFSLIIQELEKFIFVMEFLMVIKNIG